MHPRRGFDAWDAATPAARAGGARVRARARPRASARGRCALRARQRRPTTGAARRTRRRTCSTACTTAACCAWSGATAASASTRRIEHDAPAAPCRPRGARRIDALVDVVVRKYAPLPAPTLVDPDPAPALRACRSTASELGDAIDARARRGSRTARVDGVDWYWPADEDPRAADHERDDARAAARAVRSDRLGPAAASSCSGAGPTASRRTRRRRKRKLGYYALPLLWRDRVDRLGAISRSSAAGCGRRSATSIASRAARPAVSQRALEAELDAAARASSAL